MYKIEIGRVVDTTNDTAFTISTNLLESIKSYLSSSKTQRETARILLLTLLTTLKTKSQNPANLYLVQTQKPVQLTDPNNNSIISANVSILGVSPGNKNISAIQLTGSYERELRFLLGHPISIKYDSDGNVADYGLPGSENLDSSDLITQFDIGIRDLGVQYTYMGIANKIYGIQSYVYRNDAGRLVKTGTWSITLSDGPTDHNFYTYDNVSQPADWVFDIKEVKVYNDSAAKRVIDESMPDIIEEAVVGSLASSEKFYVAR